MIALLIIVFLVLAGLYPHTVGMTILTLFCIAFAVGGIGFISAVLH